MTDKAGERIDRALEVLNNIRTYQTLFYTTLILWTLVITIPFAPTSPIVRFMPGWVYLSCVGIQVVAPLVTFAGQWVQRRFPHDRRQTENGWWLQAGADTSIWWTLAIAVTAFAQSTDEPSAVFVIAFLSIMMMASLLLVTRDILEIVRCRCLRRRAFEAAADES